MVFSDHSPLTVLGEDAPGNVTFVLSLAAYGDALVVAHENGCMKIWRNVVLLKSKQVHNGAIFLLEWRGSSFLQGVGTRLLMCRLVRLSTDFPELLGDEFGIDATSLGSIACDSVITSLLYWQAKLFVGRADRVIKFLQWPLESAFSTSGRVLDPFRSSLTSKMVEALICAQNWLRSSSIQINLRECMDDVEQYEEIESEFFSSSTTQEATIVED